MSHEESLTQTAYNINCLNCHGDTPVGGAITLTSHEDWHQTSPLYDPTKKVYEVAQLRINNGEMPQGGTMDPADLATLDAWLLAGAVAAEESAGPAHATPRQVPAYDGDLLGMVPHPAPDPPEDAVAHQHPEHGHEHHEEHVVEPAGRRVDEAGLVDRVATSDEGDLLGTGEAQTAGEEEQEDAQIAPLGDEPD